MVQGFGDADTTGRAGEVTTLPFDLGQNFFMGIGRAGEIVAASAGEHGEVVEVVPGHKSGLGAEIQERLDMAEAGTLVVVGMGKTEIRTVPDGEDLRPVLENLSHHLFGVGDAVG